jgi:hypothetical protein
MWTTTHLPARPQTPADVAASLTETALEVLHRAGLRGDSIEIELELWRSLEDEIEREVRWRRWVPVHDDGPLNGVAEQLVHRAALHVAGEFVPERPAAELEARIRPLVASLRVAASVRVALLRLFARPQPSRPLGRSGVVRRLQVNAMN